MNKELLKAIKLISIISIITALLFSCIVSQDEYHLLTCHDDDCTYCAMIFVAQNIVRLSVLFILNIMVSVIIYYVLSRLYNNLKVFIQSSLVFQKVQFNE